MAIYLDHNSTTPVDPRVLEDMLPYFGEVYGNASSKSHAFGWQAEEAVDTARERVATLIGARPQEMYFTSGATEAINLAIQGIYKQYADKGNHIVTCQTEHKAVLDTCAHLESQGASVTYLPVTSEGLIDLDELENALTDRTILICIMHANNETGVIQPLREIGELAEKNDCLFMTDATQSIGKIPFDVDDNQVAITCFSAHKMYGPKGVGALYVRKPKVKLEPLLYGGGQEKTLRPGTLNIPGIVGLGVACQILHEEGKQESDRLAAMKADFEQQLLNQKLATVNGAVNHRLPNTSNLCFHELDGERLIRTMKDVAVSQGSACTSTIIEPSHVLKAMGLTDEEARASIRFGLGRFTTPEELNLVVEKLATAIEEIKA